MRMEILSWEELLGREKKREAPLAMTIGVFDGVHAGHGELLKAVRNFAGEKKAAGEEAKACVITFRENPKKILLPGAYPGDILRFTDKLAKLEDSGMERAVIIDFSAGFGKLTGADFMSLVFAHCPLEFLAIGEDFHFGCRRDTGARKAKAFFEPLGVRVDILPPVYHEGQRISSTRIRGFIRDGNFSAAVSMLGHPYRLVLPGGRGAGRLAREAFTQALPQKGSFPVVFEGTAGRREGVLAVDGHGVSWHYDGDVEAITFI
jgi:riboflavin kinase/FMN adenylyltransferase